MKRRKSNISLGTWYKNVINISITQKTGIFVHCRWECKIVLQPKSDKRKKAKISTQGNNTGVDLIKPLQVYLTSVAIVFIIGITYRIYAVQ